MDLPVTFGEWIKRRRKALDLTQAELAQRAGCSVFALRKIETGERRPSKQLAGLLAQVLEIPPEDQSTFIRVARRELNLERLRPPSLAPAAGHTHVSKPTPPPVTLPVMPTPLVGRDPELTALSQLLGDTQCRLLTLTGTGGVGKTRLAIEVASRNQGLFSDGACFVSLAPLNSPAFLVPVIANALGFAIQGQIEPRMQLLNHLSAKQVLLVLDNVEHLLESVGLFAELLERAPKVKLLATSRERLNLQGEWVFEIQGLPVPPSGQVEHAEDYSSVALFIQSARRTQAGFELQAGERVAVVSICQMVEGMPLGIELAAAWTSVLTSAEIAQEIRRSLDFLATSLRDVPVRQRSLRAAFDHSWNLLSTDERRMLSRLAIFRGGFERQAAEQVAGASLSSLLALASKSLLRRKDNGRYDLHEVVRQYALSHLEEDPLCEARREQHSDFYLALLRDREKALKGVAQREALQELTDEIDNVRAAWTWAVEREKFAPIGQALRSFGLLCDMRGWMHQGIEQVEMAVQALRAAAEENGRQKVLGQALAQQGMLFFRLGQHNQAQTLFEESLAILRPTGDLGFLPDPLIYYGVVMYLNGEFERAQLLLEDGLACARSAGDTWFESLALFNLGYMNSCLGSYTEANERMKAGLAIWRELGDPRFTALGLNFLGPVAIQLGRYAEAEAYLRESLLLTKQLDDRWGMGTAYRYLGLAALSQGDISEAQFLIQKSMALFTELGTDWDIGRSLIYLGEASMAAGASSEARHSFLDALRLAMEVQAAPLALETLLGLAHLHTRAGEVEKALAFSIFVSNQAASTQDVKDRAGRLALEAQTQLTDKEIQSARQWLQNRSLEMIANLLLDGKLI